MKNFLRYLIPIVICFVVGWLGSLVQSSALEQWYPSLRHSVFTPPAILFLIVWIILYLLMGLSLGSLLVKGIRSLIPLWSLQLLFNFLWSVCFFGLQSPFSGLIAILILDVLVLLYLIEAATLRRLAAWLWAPYFVWLMLATYLNIYIYLYN